VSGFVWAWALVALFFAGAPSSARAGSGVAPGPTGTDSGAFCTNYSTGADTHTACAPRASAPHGSAVACHNYTVGSDTYAECAAVAVPRLSDFRERKPGAPLPAPALRCSMYHIGTSVYTDCR
jgi:hypothetical protein